MELSSTTSEKRKSRAPASSTISLAGSLLVYSLLRFEHLSISRKASSSGSRWVFSKSNLVSWNQGKLRSGLKMDGFAAADESGEFEGDLKDEIFELSWRIGWASSDFHAGAQEHIEELVSIQFRQVKEARLTRPRSISTAAAIHNGYANQVSSQLSRRLFQV